MAISSVGSNARPGVCTSTTRPTTPFEGQLIYETDTNRVLVWEGAAWVMPNQTTTNPPGLELVTPTGATNGTVSNGVVTINSTVSSVTVNGAFSSTYSSYRIVMSNITMSSTASGTLVYLKMHDGTNPANSNYNWAYIRLDIAAGVSAVSSGSLQVDGVIIGRGTGDKFGTAFDVINPNLATHTIFPFLSAVNVSTGYMYTGSGMHQTSTAYSGFQVIPSTGTLTGGTIAVYGYRN